MSIPTRGLWQYSYAVPAEMEAPVWRNLERGSSRLSDPEMFASQSIYTADGSGTVSHFTKKSGLAIYNVFSHWAFSSAKNVGNNNIKKKKKNPRNTFSPFLREKGVDRWEGALHFNPKTSAIPYTPSFLTLMSVAHHFSVCRDHCTTSKLRPRILAPTRTHFHHMFSEDAYPQKAIASKYHDVSTIISNCTLKHKAKPTPEKTKPQKTKNSLK